MGRVTEREAGRAADIARGVGGVRKVVRVFDLLTEAELAASSPGSHFGRRTGAGAGDADDAAGGNTQVAPSLLA